MLALVHNDQNILTDNSVGIISDDITKTGKKKKEEEVRNINKSINKQR